MPPGCPCRRPVPLAVSASWARSLESGLVVANRQLSHERRGRRTRPEGLARRGSEHAADALEVLGRIDAGSHGAGPCRDRDAIAVAERAQLLERLEAF